MHSSLTVVISGFMQLLGQIFTHLEQLIHFSLSVFGIVNILLPVCTGLISAIKLIILSNTLNLLSEYEVSVFNNLFLTAFPNFTAVCKSSAFGLPSATGISLWEYECSPTNSPYPSRFPFLFLLLISFPR